jgi:hypothetical protein
MRRTMRPNIQYAKGRWSARAARIEGIIIAKKRKSSELTVLRMTCFRNVDEIFGRAGRVWLSDELEP